MKIFALVAAVLLTPPAVAADSSHTRIDMPGQNGPGWFLCDGIDAPFVALVGKPDAAGSVRIGLLDKNRPGASVTVRSYGLGRADPGAGQVYWSLTQGGRDAGNLHAFNPGAFGDPAAVRTPPFTSMALGDSRFQCRWRANTRLIAVAARRTLLVREDAAGRLIYESFDYAARPPIEQPDGVQRTTRASQRVTGGREAGAGGATTFAFANAGYGYVITVPATGPASLAISRGGRVIQRETLLAYTLAPR
ncbi:hypothetical protein [Sphingomonas solaris]|uniref:Uncharacterized protein n=1 Tax=Alterirhizorhabdus solaris TaxID=2529389 RepID=A0A558R1M2_9SPHN|nr:hypothetical protein [Sphingomonas solaris]TVV73277.1 hypothetical protein FOY91_12560 [Sphingomonas solaris]